LFLRATFVAAAIAMAAMLTLAGCAVAPTGGAQAATFEPGLPLSPVSQLPLSPMSQQNAVRKAKDYLDYTAFSRQGLIKQLEYDNFSTEDAVFAVDSITVDWNEQAAKKAKDYLGYTAFSHSGLINQLEYDGFTPAQAEYGVAAAGL
jgi:Host cell surface-exposed lipoprotein